MDDLLLLLILDHVSGGAYRGVVNIIGFLIAVGLFFAHPILGIVGLIIWGILVMPRELWKPLGLCLGCVVLAIVWAALVMRNPPIITPPMNGIIFAVAVLYGVFRYRRQFGELWFDLPAIVFLPLSTMAMRSQIKCRQLARLFT
jgi:hypothetical protein